MSKTNNEIYLTQDMENIKEDVKLLQHNVEKNTQVIDELVKEELDKCCKELDNFMSFVKKVLQDEQNPPTAEELDDYVLRLPTIMYFVGDKMESCGIKDDISKAMKMEKYNDFFSEEATGTIDDKKSQTELKVQKESLVNSVYSRVYKKLKLRMDIADEMLQSLKKVISRRMESVQLSKEGY